MRALLVVALCVLGSLPASAQERPDVVAADSLSLKIDTIRERYRTREPKEKDFRMSESEINAYLAYRLLDQIPKGVEGLWVRIGPDVQSAGGRVDLSAIKERMSGSPLAFFLTGVVPLEIKAKLSAKNGVGKLELQNVLFGGVEVPRSLLDHLLAYYSKSSTHPEGVRIDEPFELPYGIRSARFLPGEVIVRQGPVESQP